MPYDPFKKIDTFKPFAERLRFSSADDSSLKANILARVLEDGKVRVYEDERRSVERTEISTDDGYVNIFKKKDPIVNKWKYVKIDFSTKGDELLDTIDIFTENIEVFPRHRFSYHKMPIGTGTGGIEEVIVHRLLDPEGDTSHLAGSNVDHEILETIYKLDKRKVV